MKKIVMELRQKGAWYVPEDDNYSLWILALFLKCDVGSNDNFLDWAKDTSKNQYGGNISTVRKINGKVLLYLPMDYEDYEINPEKYSLTVPIEKFIYILEEWHRILHIETPYVIIAQEDNGEVKIFASDTNPEPVIS